MSQQMYIETSISEGEFPASSSQPSRSSSGEKGLFQSYFFLHVGTYSLQTFDKIIGFHRSVVNNLCLSIFLGSQVLVIVRDKYSSHRALAEQM